MLRICALFFVSLLLTSGIAGLTLRPVSTAAEPVAPATASQNPFVWMSARLMPSLVQNDSKPAASAPEMTLVSAERGSEEELPAPQGTLDHGVSLSEEAASSSGVQMSRPNLPIVDAMTSQQVAMTYTLYQVMRWAHDYSPEGRLLESEGRAVMSGIDHEDPDACCSARLIQSVLAELALGRRAEDAASAAKAYHQLIAATEGLAISNTALEVHDELLEMADEAERLELPDGDPMELRQARFDLLDAKTRQSYAIKKLRQELARLTGRPESEVAVAVMNDPLPHSGYPVDTALAVQLATSQRHDLLAVQTLCRELRRCNLPAARQLLGMMSPGAGLSLATAVSGMFKCLKDDHSDDDLAARKKQCRQMLGTLKQVVRNQTLQAILDVRLASERLELADQKLAIALERVEIAVDKIDLDQVPPGSDLLIELEVGKLEGDRLQRRMDLAVAIDELNHVQNTPLSSVAL